MADIDSQELFVVNQRDSTRKPGTGWKIRVVMYVKDGKAIAVKLECGEYYKHDDGGTRFKAKGFALKDLEACKPQWAKIMDLLRNPPPVPTGKPLDQDHNEDEAPFG